VNIGDVNNHKTTLNTNFAEMWLRFTYLIICTPYTYLYGGESFVRRQIRSIKNYILRSKQSISLRQTVNVRISCVCRRAPPQWPVFNGACIKGVMFGKPWSMGVR